MAAAGPSPAAAPEFPSRDDSAAGIASRAGSTVDVAGAADGTATTLGAVASTAVCTASAHTLREGRERTEDPQRWRDVLHDRTSVSQPPGFGGSTRRGDRRTILPGRRIYKVAGLETPDE